MEGSFQSLFAWVESGFEDSIWPDSAALHSNVSHSFALYQHLKQHENPPNLLRLLAIPNFNQHFAHMARLHSVSFLDIDQQLHQIHESAVKTGAQYHQAANRFERFERSCTAQEQLMLVCSELVVAHCRLQMGHLEALHSDILDNLGYIGAVTDCLCVAISNLEHLPPIGDLVRLLLHYECGCELLLSVCVNVPALCSVLVDELLNLTVDVFAQERFYTQQCRLLLILLEVRPASLQQSLRTLQQAQKSPALFVLLAAKLCESDQFAPTLIADLLSDHSLVQSAITQQKQVTRKDGRPPMTAVERARLTDWADRNVTLLIDRLCSLADQIVQEPDSDQDIDMEEGTSNSSDRLRLFKSTQQMDRVCDLLRVLCLLREKAKVNLRPEQSKVLLRLICCRCILQPDTFETATRLLSICLATVVACASLFTERSSSASVIVIEWLNWMLQAADTPGALHLQMMLLVAFHFHSNQMQQLAMFIRQTLGFKMYVREGSSLQWLRSCIVQQTLTEAVVAQCAARMKVTPQLSALTHGYLPVHCILQLLKSRSFARYKVTIKDWIIAQLSECVCPCAGVMVELLTAYVLTVLTPPSNTSTHDNNPPLDQHKLMRVFSGERLSESEVPGRVLVLYYLLYFDQCYEREIRHFPADSPLRTAYYSDALWAAVPLRYLLHTAGNNPQSYSAIYPPLIKLVAAQMPYMMPPSAGPNDQSSIPSISQPITTCTVTVTPAQLTAAANEQSTEEFVRLLSLVCRVTVSERMQYVDVLAEALPKILLMPQRALNAMDKYWGLMQQVLARRLYESSLYALRHESMVDQPREHYKHTLICDDPLLVLRCDARVFANSTVLGWWLRMLAFYQSASRHHLRHQLAISALPVPIQDGATVISVEQQEEERCTLMDALVGAQESAVVQILLEVCMSTDMDKWQLARTRTLICDYLHQMFIAQPSLLKLVIYQGFDSSLIPLVVHSVPSLHVCLEYMPELLAQPSLRQRAFAMCLLAGLCQEYNVVKAYDRAKLCVNVCRTLMSVLPCAVSVALMLHCTQALAQMATVFPQLAQTVTALLTQVACMCDAAMHHPHTTMGISQGHWEDKEDTNERRLKRLVHTAFETITTN